MSEKLVWTCDGCDVEKVVVPGRPDDWHKVTVHIEGLAGYPTCRREPAEPDTYHLCKDCSQRFYDKVRPHLWPRAVPEGRAA